MIFSTRAQNFASNILSSIERLLNDDQTRSSTLFHLAIPGLLGVIVAATLLVLLARGGVNFLSADPWRTPEHNAKNSFEHARNVVLFFGALAAIPFGLITIVNALRRTSVMRDQEQTARKNEKHTRDQNLRDERRLEIDAYARAVEQLGSASPAVRLGGLHALEALARASDKTSKSTLRVQIKQTIESFLSLERGKSSISNVSTTNEPGHLDSVEVGNDTLTVTRTALRILSDICDPMDGIVKIENCIIDGASIKIQRLEFEFFNCTIFGISIEGYDGTVRFNETSIVGQCNLKNKFVDITFLNSTANTVSFPPEGVNKSISFQGHGFTCKNLLMADVFVEKVVGKVSISGEFLPPSVGVEDSLTNFEIV